nr:septal ring lytic transglycosylase RlpA family protein [uncultured Desulfobacter sp.]
MSVTTCLQLSVIVSLLFLAFGCGNVKSPSPVQTVSKLEKSPIRAKKARVDVSIVPKEKTASAPVLRSLLKPVQKSVPQAVQAARQPIYYEIGRASFYADKFQSRKTASGEPFNQKAKTAAHRQLPFGTKVKVTNKKNKKSVIVTINDRGPFVEGRIIDLSKFAFSRIGNTRDGILNVEIQIVDQNDLDQHDYDPDQS